MPVVWTLEEKCKRCYSCIRECPAKAIKVENGQAKVIANRCLGCGHCVVVCSQGAKAVQTSVDAVQDVLQSNETSIAMLAPTFPAVFPEMDAETVIGAVRQLGFTQVVEVAFGADLVNKAYNSMLHSLHRDEAAVQPPILATSCPAIVSYVEKYAPDLVPNLAPIVSPMIAMARVARKYYGADANVVFIGPCTAKKLEILEEGLEDDVDEVLTFDELRQLWDANGIKPEEAAPTDFDPPQGYLGRAYPVSGGFVRSAGLPTDVMNDMVIVSEGSTRVLNLLESIQEKQVPNELVDILFCEGCINGPFSNHDVNYFHRRQRIVKYTENGRRNSDFPSWRHAIEECLDELDFHRSFQSDTVERINPTSEEIREILKRIDKHQESDELNCGACGYETCQEYAIAVYRGLAESDMCLPYLIDRMERMQIKLKDSLNALADTQEQLLQHEKLASIGQLAAGVAHEINNPLGSILLYAHLLKDNLPEENPLCKDVDFIKEEARRCQKIAAGLLDFSRQGNLNLQDHNVNTIVEKLVKAVREQRQFKKVEIVSDLQPDLPSTNLDPDQIYQVFLNIAINAAEAMPDGGTLTLKTRAENDRIQIYFIDTGNGITDENMSKLFTPFFTTKQIGKGTGLGLAIAYGILKMHKGNIKVISTTPGEGTTFMVDLPVQHNDDQSFMNSIQGV